MMVIRGVVMVVVKLVKLNLDSFALVDPQILEMSAQIGFQQI